MAAPKQRKTKSRRDQRRSHIFIEGPKTTSCPKCGKPVLAHTVCQNCGFYKGNEVIDVMKKLTKKERKKKQKEIETQEGEEKKAKPLSMEELSRK
jgi:large subunit ribosomal protein L32